MKKVILLGALLTSSLVHADELTPLLPSDPNTYNRLRDIVVEEDKQAFLSARKGGSVAGDNMKGPVTPSELYKSYERNELAANKIYKGVSVRVLGTANEIGEDALGKPYIDAISGKPDALSSLRSVKLYFSKASERLLNLSKGDKVDLICVGKGYIVHTPILDQCYFTSDLNVDNLLKGQILSAEQLTLENLSKLPSEGALKMNLFILLGANASSEELNKHCQKATPQCFKFLRSDGFTNVTNKYIEGHKEELKLLLAKIVASEKQSKK